MHVPPASSGSFSSLRWGLKCQQCEKCRIKMERVLGTKLETRQITFKYWLKVSDSLKLILSCLCQSITLYCLSLFALLVESVCNICYRTVLFVDFFSGSKNMSQITTNGENEGTTKIIAPSPVKRYVDQQFPSSF